MSPMYPHSEAFRHNFSMAHQGPLGKVIVEAANTTCSPFSNPAVSTGIRVLSQQLNALNNSPHPDDKAAIDLINREFRANDAPYMTDIWDYEIQENVFGWLNRGNPDEIFRFLRWNASRYWDHQFRLCLDRTKLHDRAMADVQKVVDYDLLPWKAVDLYYKAIKESRLIALDSFEAGKHLCAGYCNLDQNIIGLANFYWRGPKGLDLMYPQGQRVYTHEGFHALRGMHNAGLARLTHHAPAESTVWFDELFTEHYAHVAQWGNPELLAPSKRAKAGETPHGRYVDERELGSLVLRDTIPLCLVGEAFMESFDGYKFTARKALDQKLRQNFADAAEELGLQKGDHIVNAIARSFRNNPGSETQNIAHDWEHKLAAVV